MNTAAASGADLTDAGTSGVRTHGLDWGLLLTAVALAAYGLLAILSASSLDAEAVYDDPFHFVTRQVAGLVLGTIAAAIVVAAPYTLLRRAAWPAWLGAVVLLVAVLTPLGHSAKGATRWISLGPVNVQPAEIAKVALIAVLADYLANNRGRLADVVGVGLPGLGLLLPLVVLVIFQKDFGTTVILLGLAGVLFFAAGLQWRWMVGGGVAAASLLVFLVLVEPYRIRRLASFLDPFADPDDAGYQVVQGWIALATGGLFGSGLASGVAQRGFLPEPHTDFVSAVVGEELGALGWVVVVGLTTLLVWRAARIAARAPDLFGMLAATGIAALFGAQAIINLGVVCGLLPAKGLVLPFLSYGASAVVVHVTCVGVLLKIGLSSQVQPSGATYDMFRGKVRVIHFVGIGGIGMSGIAEVLITLGFRVTGSDLKDSATVERLRQLGATVALGHQAAHVGEADVVVVSSAVRPENPEVAAALARGTPVIRRAEMLAELMRLKYGIAIAGTHGKTTTTSMVAGCLAAAGLDPTVVIGGRFDRLGGTNAKLGAGEYLVAEADESDGTFNVLSPTVTVVTNIDPEHLDHHGTLAQLEDAFADFANRIPFYGFSVLCLDHPRVQALIPRVRRRVVTYGFARHADVRATHVRHEGLHTRFAVSRGGERLGDIHLGMPGRHNVQNATGAIATALELSIPFAQIAAGLDGFTGVYRRFTVVGEPNGVMLVDDYAHHPVEIEATLAAADAAFPERRIVAVFQPHRFTRVRDLWDGFCTAFNDAAEVVVCPVYPAGEEPIDGIDHERIVAEMRDRGHKGTRAVADLGAAVDLLAGSVRPGDVVISLGAGNVNQVVRDLDARLR